MGLFSTFHLGIDLTPTAIRVVGIKRTGTRARFMGCKEILFPVSEDGEPAKELGADQLSAALRQAMQSAAPKPLGKGMAILAIPESKVLRRVLELPPMRTDDELRSAVQLELMQFLPDEMAESEFDYQHLGVLPDGSTQQVMAVAVARGTVTEYMSVVKGAGLSMAAIDVMPAALARAVVSSDEKKAVIVVSIDSENSTISLYQGGAVRVTGIVTVGSGSLEGDDDAPHLKRLTAALADEIAHVIKFYTNRTIKPAEIKEVRLAGEGSLVHGLIEGLKTQIEVPTVMAKPIITVPAFCDRRFLAALGSALYPKNGIS